MSLTFPGRTSNDADPYVVLDPLCMSVGHVTAQSVRSAKNVRQCVPRHLLNVELAPTERNTAPYPRVQDHTLTRGKNREHILRYFCADGLQC